MAKTFVREEQVLGIHMLPALFSLGEVTFFTIVPPNRFQDKNFSGTNLSKLQNVRKGFMN